MKSITIKLPAIGKANVSFEEYVFPELDKLLQQGWYVKEVHQATTNVNTGFLFLTFILAK